MYYDETQQKWKLIATYIFMVTDQNKTSNEYFDFTVK